MKKSEQQAATPLDQPKNIFVLARVLVECSYGKPNDVVEVPISVVSASPECLDSNPEAVAAARS